VLCLKNIEDGAVVTLFTALSSIAFFFAASFT
jgi:hypothetical protein